MKKKQTRRPYLTSFERAGLRKGLRRSIEAVAELRFGEEAQILVPLLAKLENISQLEALLETLGESPTTLEQVCLLAAEAKPEPSYSPYPYNGAPLPEDHVPAQRTTPPFYTSMFDLGTIQGVLEGIEVCLEVKYGPNALALMPEIQEVEELEALRAILKAIKTAASPEELRQTWAAPGKSPSS
jgi:hypothetical protein